MKKPESTMDLYRPNIVTLPSVAPLKEVDWRGGVLLRMTNWLGDALMTRPAAYKLKTLLPGNVRLVAFTTKGLAPLWKACDWIDDVVSFPGHHPDDAAIEAVRKMDLGLAVIFPNSFSSAWDIRKIGIPRRYGRRGRWRRLLLTDSIEEWKRSGKPATFHQLSYYLQLVSAFGPITWDDQCPPLAYDERLAKKHGIVSGEKWLALAPGAAFGPAKQWPDEYFAEIAKWHIGRGGRIAIVGTPKEIANAEAICKECPQAVNLAGKTSLDELMAVLASVDCVVANDSGAMHLSAALGTPGVAVFGSTDPVATGPVGEPWNLCVPAINCRPCFKRVCPLEAEKQYTCLKMTSPEKVIAALNWLE